MSTERPVERSVVEELNALNALLKDGAIDEVQFLMQKALAMGQTVEKIAKAIDAEKS